MAVSLGFLPAPLRSGDTGAFPAGWLTLTTSSIALGSRPHLQWKIAPSSLDGRIEVEENGGFSLLRDALLNIRVLGVSPVGLLTGQESGPKLGESRVEVRLQVDGQGYQPIFFDSQQQSSPINVDASLAVSKDQAIDFGARIQTSDGGWTDWFSSSNSNRHVVALKNGESAPAALEGTPSKFLAPYLDAEGRVSIGPNDLLILIEATAGAVDDPDFDLQDAAVLVTLNEQFAR